MVATQPHVVWFKRDLRLRDHEPLVRAAEHGPVIAIYICEPHVVWDSPDHDDRHWGFIRECLADLHASLLDVGVPLTVRIGDAVNIFEQLRLDYNISHIWAHEETGNLATFARDTAVMKWAKANRINFIEIPQSGVVRKCSSRTHWSKVRKERLDRTPLPAPEHITPVHGVYSEPLPTAHNSLDRQRGGEQLAHNIFDEFLSVRVNGYQRNISSPLTAWDGCSRLSPYLAYGAISARDVITTVRRKQTASDNDRSFSLRAFEDRMAWRDHFMQKLEDHPDMELRSSFPQLDELRMRVDEAKLEAWQQGHTGFPFVDACIRALQHTGWINFRMRAMLVSFAAFDLWLPWQSFAHQLARWFVDYEPGIHWSQIHMQSGVTANPTLRIYNPVKQSHDQDPDGVFIRQWVPELSYLDNNQMHEPWKHADLLSSNSSVYRNPIVHHEHALRLARERIEPVRQRLGITRRSRP